MIEQIIQTTVRAFPAVRPLLSPDALKIADSYDGIRSRLFDAVFDAVSGYLSGSGYVTGPRSAMSTALAQAYIETADAAFEEIGAELPLDPDTASWARAQLQEQLDFVDQLFEDLRQLRRDGEFDADVTALARAEGYTRSLDSFFGEAKMRGSENITLEFGGTDGKESCDSCQKLVGKRHKIKYILEHNLIPKPGNKEFDCEGWECEHYWFNPKTGERFDG